MKHCTLLDLESGGLARIVSICECDQAYRQKLLALGLTRGTTLKLIRKAPLGDPIQIEIRGFNLSLRKHEAQVIRIERMQAK
jgi:ferrous iron transport protein A